MEAAANPPSTPPTIPAVDLSPFFVGDGEGYAPAREEAIRAITGALETTGFFRVTNHGVPAELMSRALDLSREFFRRPQEEKLEWRPVEGSEAPLPAGYARTPETSPEKKEYLLMFPPETGFNVYPAEPPGFREVLVEVFGELRKLASRVEEILNEGMGLPHNFLREYNDNRSCDLMAALRYPPATDDGQGIGNGEHEDCNVLAFIFQDDVGGLEVLQDGEWIPAVPEEGTIIVNVGDIIQVLSNDKLKSATHRVMLRSEHRHSYAFFYNLDGNKWVEPLKQFTERAGEKPKYKGFLYREYLQLRMRNKTHPPSRPQDIIRISHYAIST